MEKIVKRLFIGGTLLTALAVCGCTIGTSYAYNGPWDNGICNDDTYKDLDVCKDNNDDYNSTDYTGVFHNKSVMTDPNRVDGSSTFSLTVNKAMVLSDVKGFKIPTTDVKTDAINAGEITASVDSNQSYIIKLKAATAAAVNLVNGTNSIPASNTVTAGVNSWGIKKKGESGYTALSTGGATFWSGSKNATSGVSGTQVIKIPVGIGVHPTLPPGLYQTNVTLTLAEGTSS